MTPSAPIPVGIVCDLLEERWPSMDLVADQLVRTLPGVAAPPVQPARLRPTMPRWPATLARAAHVRALVNANRYLDRHRRYPRWLRRHRGTYGAYHVVDHTYAHLVRELPAEHTVVTCHDVDAFRSLFDPANEPRSAAFRRMTERLLAGVRAAAIVACDSEATREALVTHGLRTERLEVVPLGVHPAFTRGTPATREIADGPVTLLHVGSTIARKRIDVLLNVLARVREHAPTMRLVRVGGAFTPAQTALARTLGVEDAIRVMPPVSHAELAGLYRDAALVLLPSAAEGFGLPVVEAMACGTPVVASDLPVLREVGGSSITYAPAGDVEHWVRMIGELLTERATSPEAWERRRQAAAVRAARFTWEAYAERMAQLYAEVARG